MTDVPIRTGPNLVHRPTREGTLLLSKWPTKRLKHACGGPIANGVGEPSEHDDPTWPRYVRITDIAGPRTLRVDTFRSLPPHIAQQAPLRVGDVIIAGVGATFGKSYLHSQDIGPACYAGYLVRVPHGKTLVPDYLAYWTESDHYWIQVHRSVIQATVQNFSADRARQLMIPVPSLKEQRAIVAFLDRETARIDGLIAKKERLLDLLEEKRAAFITRAVTKGLDPAVPMKESGVKWLGQVPAHWELVRIGRKIHLERGVDITKDEQVEGTVPVVSSGGVASWHDRALAAGPGVLVGRKGTAGAVYYVEEAYWPHDTTLWVSNFRGNHPRYVFYRLTTMDLASLDTGTANPTLNRNLVHPLVVSWPPLPEQVSIADYLDRQEDGTRDLVDKIRRAIALLREYRTALVSAAVTGQIDVSGLS